MVLVWLLAAMASGVAACSDSSPPPRGDAGSRDALAINTAGLDSGPDSAAETAPQQPDGAGAEADGGADAAVPEFADASGPDQGTADWAEDGGAAVLDGADDVPTS